MIFDVHILGSGSAIPKLHRNPTSQYINVLERYILIDCAEGTQMQMQKFKVKPQRIQHILISHLHGDHYFGLMGLLSSMHLNGRTKSLNLYAPEPLQKIIYDQLHHSKTTLAFDIHFHPLQSEVSELIYEDKCIEIHTIPLEHRVYCNGFLIKEKEKPFRINKEVLGVYKVPVAMMHKLIRGEDWIKENGEVIKNDVLTLPPLPKRSYAFCSDTRYTEKILPLIQEVDLLYHEATFLNDMLPRAKKTFHTTALQAAQIAKLANAKKLLLGHFSARYDTTEEFIIEAKSVFENVETVNDGDIFSIL